MVAVRKDPTILSRYKSSLASRVVVGVTPSALRRAEQSGGGIIAGRTCTSDVIKVL